MQLFWAPLAELVEARNNKKEFPPAEQALAASKVTVLAQALQAILDEARKPRAKKTAAKKPPGSGAAWFQAALRRTARASGPGVDPIRPGDVRSHTIA
jgi:hypothetical protein